jgi:hypothetical protein
MIVYLRYPLVVWTGDPPPFGLVFDTILQNAPNATIGQVWNGAAFVAPAANSEHANASTIDTQLLAAMAAIDTYAALSAPSAAQRLNYERLLGKCVKQLIRKSINKLDGSA